MEEYKVEHMVEFKGGPLDGQIIPIEHGIEKIYFAVDEVYDFDNLAAYYVTRDMKGKYWGLVKEEVK